MCIGSKHVVFKFLHVESRNRLGHRDAIREDVNNGGVCVCVWILRHQCCEIWTAYTVSSKGLTDCVLFVVVFFLVFFFSG